MSVFRINKNNNYTTISNLSLREKGLSFRAKGMLATMLSLPNDWDYSVAGLVTLSTDGKDSVIGGLKELEQHGYLVRTKLIDKKGRFNGYQYDIYEEPQAIKPYAENPNTDCPNTEKPTQQNTKELNTKELNAAYINNNACDKENGVIHNSTEFIHISTDRLRFLAESTLHQPSMKGVSYPQEYENMTDLVLDAIREIGYEDRIDDKIILTIFDRLLQMFRRGEKPTDLSKYVKSIIDGEKL